MRPLTIVEVQWALALAPDYALDSLDDCKDSKNFIADSRLKNRINTPNCSLTEIVPSTDSSTVQFIHQSIKDFFMSNYILYLETLSPNVPAISAMHCQLRRCYLQYFRLAIHAHPKPFDREECYGFLFLRYIVTF